jgi:phosphate transport system substrate-binding protein
MRWRARWLGLLFPLLIGACASSSTPAEDEGISAEVRAGTKQLTTPATLRELTRTLADNYVTRITKASNELKAGTPEQRREAIRIRLRTAVAAWDIASNADAFTQLVDLMVVITLQSMVWIDDGLADERFGELGEELVRAVRNGREEAWRIGELVFTSEQLSLLDALIWNWRVRNPTVKPVTQVRFSTFADSRSKSEIQGVEAGGGLFAPVSEVRQSADELRLLVERMFYFTKRAPQLLAWQTELLRVETLSDPRIARMFDNYNEMTGAIERATRTMESLPDRLTDERKAVLDAVEGSTSKLHEVVKESRTVVEETQTLTASLDAMLESSRGLIQESGTTATAIKDTVEAIDRLLQRIEGMGSERPEDAGPSEPFRIGDYTKAIIELATTVRETQELLLKTEQLIASEAWTNRISDVQDNVQTTVSLVGDESRTLLRFVFWSTIVFFFAFFLMLGLYRLAAHYISKRLGAVLLALAIPAQAAEPENLPEYRPVGGVIGVVDTAGSAEVSQLLGPWERGFRAVYPGTAFEVTVGGSATAMAALIAKKAEVALMSRAITAAEREAFKKARGYDVTEIVVAVDAIAVFVNKANPVQGLTLQQLDALYSSTRKRGGPRARQWGAMGLPPPWSDEPVALYGLRAKTGAHFVFRQLVLQGGDYRSAVTTQPGAPSLVNAIGAYRGAVGFASAQFRTRRTRVVPIAREVGQPFVSPSGASCRSGEYPLTRRFHAYVDAKALKPVAVEFLAFVSSEEGQRRAEKAGVFAIPADLARRNLAAIGKPVAGN